MNLARDNYSWEECVSMTKINKKLTKAITITLTCSTFSYEMKLPFVYNSIANASLAYVFINKHYSQGPLTKNAHLHNDYF